MDNKEQHLGKKSEGSIYYDPELLRSVDRIDERQKSGIGNVLPFYGMDIWNAYEFTYLNMNGVPQQYLLKIAYSADSPKIVESKSLKLYLNSFAMTKVENIEAAVKLITQDLEHLLQYKVHVMPFNVHIEFPHETTGSSLHKFINLDVIPEINNAQIDEYTRNPELLECRPQGSMPEGLFVKSTSLRSNCKVTHQPDYGTIYIAMVGKKFPTLESLYKYIVSYRGENHFHEEIVEQVYKDLMDKFEPVEMVVFAKYTRRGGIDISPLRVSHLHLLSEKYLTGLVNINKGYIKDIRQ